MNDNFKQDNFKQANDFKQHANPEHTNAEQSSNAGQSTNAEHTDDEQAQAKRRRILIIVMACVLALLCGLFLALAMGAFGNFGQQETQNSDQTIEEPTSTENAAQDSTKDAQKNEQENKANEQTTPAVQKKTICIDAGHSGHSDSTPSSASPYSDTTILTEPGGTEGDVAGPEYQICLDVALLLQTQLEAKGYNVVQVRTDNTGTYSPKDRAIIANDCNADLFIRLHCDSAGSSANGFYTLVPGDAGYQGDGQLYLESQRIGRAMHNIIVNELGENDRGVTVRDDQGGFNWCKVPAVLFEMANMDNAHDDALLATQSYKEKLAVSIADATKEVLG